MKKLILVLLMTFCFGYTVHAADKTEVYATSDQIYQENEIVYNKKTRTPFTGILKDYDKNGKLQYKTPYKNGEREGIHKWYYTDGNLRSETPYKNGKIDGIEKFYYRNGNLMEKIPYKKGEKEGIKKEYYYNGKLQYETPYKNGEVDGIKKEYYPDGRLWKEFPYENGRETGKIIRYGHKGKLDIPVPSEAGKETTWESYYDNGQLELTITFEVDENGNEVWCKEEWYYESGKKLRNIESFPFSGRDAIYEDDRLGGFLYIGGWVRDYTDKS